MFERVLLSQEDLIKAVLIDGSKVDTNGHVVQPKVLHYLAECYLRCHNRQNMLQKRVRQKIILFLLVTNLQFFLSPEK